MARRQRRPLAVRLCLALLGTAGAGLAAPQLPDSTEAFLAEWCLGCHDAETAKGELVLEDLRLDWDEPAAARSLAETLERMRRVLERGDMPPPRYPQPGSEARAAQVEWIEAELVRHQPLGGRVPRRLNRAEYEAAVHTLFPLRKRLGVALPPDTPAHGFDTVSEALVISPTHMRQYLEAATWVADELIPLGGGEPMKAAFSPLDFAGSKTHYLADRQRLVSGGPQRRRGSRIRCRWSGLVRMKLNGRSSIR